MGRQGQPRVWPACHVRLAQASDPPRDLLSQCATMCATSSAMDPGKTTLERAFEMARSGRYDRLMELRGDLKKEGYDNLQLEGPAVRKQITELIKQAKLDRVGRP